MVKEEEEEEEERWWGTADDKSRCPGRSSKMHAKSVAAIAQEANLNQSLMRSINSSL